MSSVYEIASEWLDRGIVPIPCYPSSKRACVPWASWQQQLPPASLAASWFTDSRRNVALLTGGIGQLIVLDFDRMSDFTNWLCNHPLDTYATLTARGAHVYFRSPALLATQRRGNCDLKAERGYVLAPPSIHPSGKSYRVLKDTDIRIVDAATLDDLLPKPQPVQSASRNAGVATPYTEPLTLQGKRRTNWVSTIKQQLPILAVVSRYTQPIPSSPNGRWFIAKCPFHHPDRHPSFWIDTHLGLSGCFNPSCKALQPHCKPMDAINFYARLHRISNQEAIRELENELSGF